MNGKLNLSCNKKQIIFYSVIFAAFAVLAFLFPYSGDDWAWGSEIGMERLESGFENYNGRYLGNLLVMLLTKSKLLQVLAVAAGMLLMCALPVAYCFSNRLSLLVFSSFLIFLIPKEIFVQSVVWTAGFSNYIPPIIIIFAYFLIVKNIFGEKPVYKKFVPIITFIIGFSCALFMENVTLYAVAVSLLIIVFARIKHKRFFLAHLANFVGCLAGTVLMFSNGAYSSILGESDTYRSTAMSEGIISTLEGHSETICNQLFVKNVPLLAVISVLCVVLAVSFLKKSRSTKLNLAVFVSVFINILSLGIIFAKFGFSYWVAAVGSENSRRITVLLLLFAVCIYCLSVLLLVTVCVTDLNAKFRILLLLVSVPVLVAPLLVVNPIGPRCFMPPYFIMAAFCVSVFDYIQKTLQISVSSNKILSVSFVAASLAVLVFNFSVYSTIHSYAEKRDEYVMKQVENGESIVTVCRLPYGSYVWTGNPEKAPWDYRYKLFNGIDENIQFEFLNYSDFDKWAEEYSRTNP